MCALSNLSKFTGRYENWRQTIRRYDLKWESSTSSLQTFLSILNTNIEEKDTWLKRAVVSLPKDYATFLCSTALTGLRPSKAANSCTLLLKLSETDKLNSYLDRDLMICSIFVFPTCFSGAQRMLLSHS